MRSSLLQMRSSLVVRASDCQCTSCNGKRSWVRSQHPPAQWNLRGSRWSSAEYSMKKNPPPQKKNNCMKLKKKKKEKSGSSHTNLWIFYAIKNAVASGGNRYSHMVETTILGANSNSAERSLRLFLEINVTCWFYKVHCAIGYSFQVSSQSFCQHLYYVKKPQLELYSMRCWLLRFYTCQQFYTMARYIFKGLSHDGGGGAKFSKNLCLLPFNDDISNDTTFSQINVYGQYL